MFQWLGSLIDKWWFIVLLPGLVFVLLEILCRAFLYSMAVLHFLFSILGTLFAGIVSCLICAFNAFVEFLRRLIQPLIGILLIIAVFASCFFLISLIPDTPNSASTSKPTVRTTAKATVTPTSTPRAISSTATPSTASFSNYYKTRYPTTWSYIEKYADDPEEYAGYYHSVWGNLQLVHGDGMVFGELADFQQELIRYPELGETIYLDNKNAIVHSTDKCYRLLDLDRKMYLFEIPGFFILHYDRCPACISMD